MVLPTLSLEALNHGKMSLMLGSTTSLIASMRNDPEKCFAFISNSRRRKAI